MKRISMFLTEQLIEKLKKQSVRSSKVASTIKDPGKALENIVNDFFAG